MKNKKLHWCEYCRTFDKIKSLDGDWFCTCCHDTDEPKTSYIRADLLTDEEWLSEQGLRKGRFCHNESCRKCANLLGCDFGSSHCFTEITND